MRNDQALLGVVRRRDALENLEAFKSGLSAGGLVGNHATDGLVEDARWGAEVEGPAERVETVTFPEVCMILNYMCEQR